MDEVDLLLLKLERTMKAKKAAETIGDEKVRELYLINEKINVSEKNLAHINTELTTFIAKMGDELGEIVTEIMSASQTLSGRDDGRTRDRLDDGVSKMTALIEDISLFAQLREEGKSNSGSE